MTTFTFVEYQDDTTGALRMVALRCELTDVAQPSLRHLNRFVAGRGWSIVAMYQITASDMQEAMHGVGIEF